MTDVEPDADSWALFDAFRRRELAATRWTHEAHVRVAWCYLRRFGLEESERRFPDDLRRHNESIDKPRGYHETITLAMLRVLAARLVGPAAAAPWSRFAAANPELLRWDEPVLLRHYTRERLFSDDARARFLAPDRLPLPTPDEPAVQ